MNLYSNCQDDRPPASEAGPILIVDDEPSIVRVLARWLEAEGYACLRAFNAADALLALELRPVTLVISDILMSGMTGMQLLAELPARAPTTAAIMVTGVDDHSVAIDALNRGAYGYVIKPFDQNEILIQVANALDRRRLVMARQSYEEGLEEKVRERTASIRQREEEIALRLVIAADYRDEETGGHIRRMGLYAEHFAQLLGWPSERVDDIRLAVPMHDIGKIGISDQVLLKPGRLTDPERRHVEQHTTIGAKILDGSSIPVLQLAREIALSHHERWDGGGYPQGLAGDAIPESGRLVAIPDVYDALVNDRVYRKAWPEADVLAHIATGAGRHFDPTMAALFLEHADEFRSIRLGSAETSAPGRGAPS